MDSFSLGEFFCLIGSLVSGILMSVMIGEEGRLKMYSR